MNTGGGRQVSWKRVGLATCVSVGLHLALLFAFALSSSGKLAATSLGGDAPGVPTQSTSTVNVTLIGDFSPVEPQSAASETQSFEKFLDMVSQVGLYWSLVNKVPSR